MDQDAAQQHHYYQQQQGHETEGPALLAGHHPPPHLQQHRSLNCRVPTAVIFENASSRTVDVVWLSYHGVPHRYHSLQPGRRAVQLTFTAHPWVFSCPADPGAVCVVDGQAVYYPPPQQAGAPQPLAVIRDAEQQPWAPVHHLHTAPAFQQAAGALLLSHKRLSAAGMDAAVGHSQHQEQHEGIQEEEEVEEEEQVLEQQHYQQHRQQQEGAGCGCPRVSWRQQQHASPGPMTGAAAELMPSDDCQQPNLGDLPQEVVLQILAAAAPTVPVLMKPPLPHGVAPGDVPADVRGHLFRAGVPVGSQRGSASVPSASGAPRLQCTAQQQQMLPQQLRQLQQQRQDPQPPPPSAVAHPLLAQHMWQ